jgi:putative tricarboxylic transport membrane protein
MGPGYAPMLIAAALAAFGVLFLVRAIVSRTSEPPEPAVFRPVLIVLGAMLAFGLLVERAGLFLALVACIGIAGLAAHERKPLQITLLALGLSATICLVFVTLLGLPIRLFPRFG